MKRTPIVLAATAAGLATVLGFHTQQMSGSILSGLGRPATGTTRPARPSGTSGANSDDDGRVVLDGELDLQLHPEHDNTTAASGTRTALGADVQYRYGSWNCR